MSLQVHKLVSSSIVKVKVAYELVKEYLYVRISMRLCSAKDTCGYHIGCREASDTNISIDILMLYVDKDVVALMVTYLLGITISRGVARLAVN